MMIVNLPRIGTIDLDHLPDDFDKRVTEGFSKYTEGTAKDYTFLDKLSFIDICNRKMTGAPNGEDAARQMILANEEYTLNEYGELPDRDEYWSMEFFGALYDEGARSARLYHSDMEDKNKLARALIRIMEVVMRY